MKKIFLLVVSAALVVAGGMFLQSCESDSMYDTHEVFLDLDIANLQSLTDNQRLILEEAENRIDRHVTFDGNQYHLSIRSGREVNMSESLFLFFRGLMDRSNSMLEDMKIEGMILIPSIDDSRVFYVLDESQPIEMIARLRAGIEAPKQGGVTKRTNFTWRGHEYWMSSSCLRRVGFERAQIAAGAYIVSHWLPKPVHQKIAKSISGGFGMASAFWLNMANDFPNGVIFRCSYLLGCNIFRPTSQ